MLQVGDAGGEKVPWAHNGLHATLVQELHQIAKGADPNVLIRIFIIKECLEDLVFRHGQVCLPVVVPHDLAHYHTEPGHAILVKKQ